MSEQEVLSGEEQYAAAREFAVAAMVAWLELGDALGRDQMTMAAEFMAAFQEAAAKVGT